MKPTRRVYLYAKEHFNEVKHTTLNPEGPGVVRIHMIPPKYSSEEIGASVAIINGQDIIPVNTSWSVLLSEFIDEVNRYEGREVLEADVKSILNETYKRVRRIYPLIGKKRLQQDILTIMETFTRIAYGQTPEVAIDYISIGEYAHFMSAPHRMDLLISAMTRDGSWHCNQRCIHCYAAGQEHAQETELSTREWKQIIDKCKENMIPQITFTGGEPTMRDDLVELVEYSKWFVTRLNTNGIKLSRELCSRLMEASLDSIQITFYSANQDIHNKLVGAAQYDNTVAGIKNALEAGLNISINTPLCTLNKDYVRTLEFLHELGITYVTCSGLITTGNAALKESESLQLGHEELKEILIEAVGFCTRNGMELSFTSPGWLEDEFFKAYGLNAPNCGACLSNMAITPSGNVVPCQSYLSSKPLGNMLNNTWDEIWNNPECIKRREYSAKTLGLCPLRIQKEEESHE